MKNLFTNSILLTICAFFLFTGGVKAKPACDKASGTGQTTAVAPGVFQGSAAVEINNQQEQAAVTTYLLGPPRETEDGTLRAVTSHVFVFADGSSYTTVDRAILTPTGAPGLYDLNTKAAISEGTGRYASASGGHLNIHGTINLITGQVVWRFTGRVCDCG